MTQKNCSESGNSPPAKPIAPAVRLEDYGTVLTLDDVASVLRCPKRSVYNISRSRGQNSPGALRFLRLPIGLRVLKSDLQNYLAA